MIACTLVSPAFEHMVFDAVRHFKDNTGMDVHIIWSDAEPAHNKKLEVSQLFKGQSVVFFDADLWVIRPLDLSQFNNVPEFVCVRDPGIFDPDQFPQKDSVILGIKQGDYFNSGFFVANFRREDHCRAFDIALQLCAEQDNGMWPGIGDHGEQSFLNVGVQRAGCTVKYLPFAYNCYNLAVRFGCYPEYPREIVCLHAAGVHYTEKQRWLQTRKEVFGEPSRAMLPGAERFYEPPA